MFPIFAGTSNPGYQIQRSLRFRASASAWVYRTVTNTPADTNNKCKTYSMWCKRSALGSVQELVSNYTSNTNFWGFYFSSDDRLCFYAIEGGVVQASKFSAAVFRDVTAHMHVMLVTDTANATAEDRVRLYVNGTRVTSWNTNTTPALNAITAAAFIAPNSGTWSLNIGRLANGTNYFDGYLADVVGVDGQALTPSSFGEFDSGGNWRPKAYTGTYGTYGFRLDFSDPTSTTTLGYDRSGQNLLTNSTTPNTWPTFTDPGGGVTISTATDPTYGSVTRITKVAGADWVRVGLYSTVSGLSGNSYTASIYCKSNGAGPGSTPIYVDAVRVGGGLVTATALPASVGVWERISATGVGPLAGTGNFYVLLSGPVGSSIDIYAPQLENGSVLGSYKPTTTTAYLGWTTNNISLTAGATYDSMLDVPLGSGGGEQGNYCTLNPLANPNAPIVTCTNGNLDFSHSASTGNAHKMSVVGTIGVASGKWYYEFTAGATANDQIGISTGPIVGTSAVANGTNFVFYASSALWNTSSATAPSAPASYTTGDVIGAALDIDNRTAQFFKNGVSQGTITAFEAGLTWFPYRSPGGSAIGGSGTFNFGQRPFIYNPPTGFKALHTGNLPTSVITNPATGFVAVTGIGSTIEASSAAALPASEYLEVFVDRSVAQSLKWRDTLRGTSLMLSSNSAAAETAYTTPTLGDAYVGYRWKAGSATTNTSGSITSQVSANVAAGFSVVSYTGDGIAGATIGHGLGKIPNFIIIKARNASANWPVYHSSIASPNNCFLDLTVAANTYPNRFNSVGFTSSVFKVGTTVSELNNSGSQNYIAYCFAEVPGYSKIGSYTGNGSVDGPFVYCGFRPKFVMAKRINSTGDWLLMDSSRDTKNVMSARLYPNLSQAEDVTPAIQDFTSNGFKLRIAAPYNVSSGIYIYMAFAESPFKYSNAR